MKDQFFNLMKWMTHKAEGRRFILGVDGLSRSGKTTLVEKITRRLSFAHVPVYVFHIDDLITASTSRYHTGYPEWYEYYYLQWEVDYLTKQLFQKIRTSESLQLLIYNAEEDEQTMHTIFLPSSCVVIIEGVFLQRKEWRGYFDYLVYLNCSREIRFKREKETTQRNFCKFINRYWKAEDFYLKTEKPLSSADHVIHIKT
ncbi:kinase [Halobacillus rhizosphaerae]|uniref:kinase n=1 Tax=Halobacillus rhizosphaerae TaxID=3064889 RepID=UPI00398B836A